MSTLIKEAQSVATQAILDRPPTTQVCGKQLQAGQHIRKMRGGTQAQLMLDGNILPIIYGAERAKSQRGNTMAEIRGQD
jgi:hypothetical protein